MQVKFADWRNRRFFRFPCVVTAICGKITDNAINGSWLDIIYISIHV